MATIKVETDAEKVDELMKNLKESVMVINSS